MIAQQAYKFSGVNDYSLFIHSKLDLLRLRSRAL
jgi:hypothetical protein